MPPTQSIHIIIKYKEITILSHEAIFTLMQRQQVRFRVGEADVFCSWIVCITPTFVVVHVYKIHMYSFLMCIYNFGTLYANQNSLTDISPCRIFFQNLNLSLCQMTTDSHALRYHTRSNVSPCVFTFL